MENPTQDTSVDSPEEIVKMYNLLHEFLDLANEEKDLISQLEIKVPLKQKLDDIIASLPRQIRRAFDKLVIPEYILQSEYEIVLHPPKGFLLIREEAILAAMLSVREITLKENKNDEEENRPQTN